MTLSMNDDTVRNNYLGTVRNLKARSIEIDWQISQTIHAAVHQGATWREIGEVLGVSGQAAWARYGNRAPQKITPQEGSSPVEH